MYIYSYSQPNCQTRFFISADTDPLDETSAAEHIIIISL